jgi:hypothetical protein
MFSTYVFVYAIFVNLQRVIVNYVHKSMLVRFSHEKALWRETYLKKFRVKFHGYKSKPRLWKQFIRLKIFQDRDIIFRRKRRVIAVATLPPSGSS